MSRATAKLTVVALALTALSGCSLVSYNSKFPNCDKSPNHAACMSAVQAYHASDSYVPVSIGGKGADTKTPAQQAAQAKKIHVAEENSVAATDTPRPIRTPAKVMRIYLGPWIGKDGDLTMPTYIYTQIEPRRWTLGTPVTATSTPDFYPLQTGPSRQPKGAMTVPLSANVHSPREVSK